ncbi:enoyl-CoA hydratase/isomerase family protein [Leucobacter sp. W1478]|uniref:enoyl-CoA hydratase/isomerase family protein n=1 Tax=Leucobacter sp. W1478 TaxID=3439065 RepID=UPI003F402ED1
MNTAARLEALTYETIELQVRDAILTITINRPKVLNALSPQVIAELRQVFGELRDSLGRPSQPGGDGTEESVNDWSIRGVIFTGQGSKSFVAGADISVMREMTPAQSAQYAAGAQELTSWIETLPVPVIAAVNGFALGGGCELAMACDFIYASENASFGQPEVGLGLIPGFGGCVRLQQCVGIAAARDLIFTGRRIDAFEAEKLGLVAHVFPDTGALHVGAEDAMKRISQQSPVAVAMAKRAVREVQALPTDAGLVLEREAFAACFGTGDMIEGTAAFVEKRKPNFPGN